MKDIVLWETITRLVTMHMLSEWRLKICLLDAPYVNRPTRLTDPNVFLPAHCAEEVQKTSAPSS